MTNAKEIQQYRKVIVDLYSPDGITHIATLPFYMWSHPHIKSIPIFWYINKYAWFNSKLRVLGHTMKNDAIFVYLNVGNGLPKHRKLDCRSQVIAGNPDIQSVSSYLPVIKNIDYATNYILFDLL